MEPLHFIDIGFGAAAMLFAIGFVGGMVSGFIGSGGAFVLTPAMMSMGVPGVVAVASNIAHKFPKALVGAYKRHKYGQVDIKLGLIMGVFATVGMLLGKHIMVAIKDTFGAAGTNLYVSFVFVVVLGSVGIMVLRDAWREQRGTTARAAPAPATPSAWVARIRAIHIPGTMVHFKSIDARVSVLVIAPLGFATGLLAGTIAVGGFIGVPAMMYLLGLPALMASATELVIAFVMGLGGTLFYAWDGLVDIRLAMIILAGSLFGIQIGAIGTTYVRDYMVKYVMAAIMLLVMVSRLFYLPGYVEDIWHPGLDAAQVAAWNGYGQGLMAFALVFGAALILHALYRGMRAQPSVSAPGAAAEPLPMAAADAAPRGPFARLLVASDGSEFSAAAVREALRLAGKCGAELHAMTLVATGGEYEGLGAAVRQQELAQAQAHLDDIAAQARAAGVRCATHVVQGSVIHDEILALAERLAVELIVMGRRGRRGLARIMLGHATAQVIGGARCAVLVVPRAARLELRQMLLATDGSAHAALATQLTAELAQACGAAVTVVSVTIEEHSAARRALAARTVEQAVAQLRARGVTARGEVPHGPPAARIVAAARAVAADLIVTGSRGRAGLQRTLLGSTSERILNETACAVLVVNTR